MIEKLDTLLQNIPLAPEYLPFVKHLIVLLVVVLLAWIADRVTRTVLINIISRAAQKSKTQLDDIAIQKKLIQRLAHLVPGTIFYLSANVFRSLSTSSTASEGGAAFVAFMQKFSFVYMIMVAALILDSILNTIEAYYSRLSVSRKRPIKSYLQVVKILAFALIVIFIIATLVDRSPWALLTGIGALTAVLLLIFKDSILGLVASIQLAAYDMIRLGDWIEMPKFGADGDVIDISLNTIKVQNWDKTITTIPTSAVLSEPVKNWRGMSESSGRRIKRHLNIDMNSIKFCDAAMLQRFKKIHYIAEYIERKQIELDAYNETLSKEKNIDKTTLVNGRHLTNLGTFRAYVEAYLKNHPKIHQGMTLLVRHLQPTEMGIPIEIYAFSNDQEWGNYEAIQADIFDHLLAILPEFGLRVFQNLGSLASTESLRA